MARYSEQLSLFTDGAVAHTSKLALADLHNSGKAETIKNKIYLAIIEYPGITRNELSRLLSIGINVISGRVNDLIYKDKKVIERGIKADLNSTKPNKKLFMKDA